MTDDKNKGTQSSDISDQNTTKNIRQRRQLEIKNKTITYAKTEPKAQENAQADRQQSEKKRKYWFTKK